jgi:SSS family solute:Na+ symporter
MTSAPPISVPLGVLFFLAYVAVSIAIGVFASRKETEEEFMIAGRRVRGLLLMATMAAGWFDGVTLSVYLAYIYSYGLSALSLFIGISLGFLLFRHYADRIKSLADKFHVYSMPEYFYRLLGRRNGIMFSIFLTTQFFGYLTINFILSGKVLAQVFPFLGHGPAVVVGGIIILIYLLLAGFKAVVRTDLYQLGIMILMTVLVGLSLTTKTHFQSGDVELGLGAIGLGNALGFIVLAGFGVLVAPDIWQRMIAAQDKASLRSGFAYSAAVLMVLALVIAVAGVVTRRSLPGIPPEDVLVRAFTDLLPYGVRELGLVLLYAVSLSSSDTVTFVVSSIISRDLKNYSTRFTDASIVSLTQTFMVIFVFGAIALAITYQQIMHIALSLGSLNLALFPVVFGSLYWRLNRSAVFWSLVVVLLSVAALSLTKTLDPETAALSLPIGLLALVGFHVIFRFRKVTSA